MEKVRIPNKGIRKEIYNLLQGSESARKSDRILYYELLKSRGIKDISLEEFAFGSSLPNFETVGRARRVIQQNFPELRADEETEERKAEMEFLFSEHFSRSVNNVI